MPYIVIISACILVGLVTYSRLPIKTYPFIIYGIAAGIVLSTTLAGPNLIGFDIHLEYYYALLRNGYNVMEPALGLPQGTSILGYISGNIWAYKVVYPLLFCLIPVGVYILARKWVGHKSSFLASFLFIAFPPFFMELPSVQRQMVASVLLVIAFILILKEDKPKYIWISIGVLCGLIPLFHYSTGIIAFIILTTGLVYSLLSKQKYWKPILLGLAILVAVSGIYFTIAQDGAVARHVGIIYNRWTPGWLQLPSRPLILPTRPPETIPPPPEDVTMPSERDLPLAGYGSLVRAALGYDFLKSDIWGRMFRITQWVLGILGLIGLWKLRKTKLFWVLGIGAFLVVALSVFRGWVTILNLSRLLSLSLIVLVPAAVIVLKPKYLAPILIVYFIFTSGLVFELTKQPDVSTYNLPYSVALSNHRIDLGATTTEGDLEVRDYIISNNLFPIYADVFGNGLIAHYIGVRNDIHWPLPKTGQDLTTYPAYMFVRSRNIQDGTLTVWRDIGIRGYVPVEDFNVDWNKNIVFQSGDARVIKIGEWNGN